MEVDIDKKLAIRKIKKKFKHKVTKIKFGKERKDGTMGVSFYIDGQKHSYSYLTDI